MSEKSILEQALLQVQTLEEAVKQNAKGILASTMKEELSDLLKESLEEEEKVADDEEMKNPMDEQPTPDEEEDDMSDDDATADDAEADDAENDTDLDNEDPTKGIEDMDSDDESDDADTSMDDFGADDFGSDEEDSDDDVMDMTGASDEEVLKVFKAMKPEDGIVVKKDGNKIELETGDDEFIIKLDGDDDDSELEEEWTEEETPVADDEEALYEIELDEEDEDEDELNESALKGLSKPKKVEPKESALKGLSKPKKVEPKESALASLSKPKKVEPKESALAGLSKPKKVEVGEEEEEEVAEAARTKSNIHGDKGGQDRAGLKSKTKYKAGSKSINEEVETLKKQNAEYKKALVLFKDKLNEVAVFNANLAYATRLFTEHSTTKQEKLTILKRFDGISTLNEAKNLFSQIKTELGTKTNVTESVVEKISNAPSTSSSQEVLAESKAYENPQFKRMKDLMSKIK
jgi:hypothetical protein